MSQTLEIQSAPAYEKSSLVMRLVRSRESGVFIAFLILFGALCIFRNHSFLAYLNLSNLSVQITLTAIAGIGVLLVVLAGGVDLSLGSTAGLCGFICALSVVATNNPILGLFVGVLASDATG